MAKKRTASKRQSVKVALAAHAVTLQETGHGQVELVNRRPPLRDVCAAWASLMANVEPDTTLRAPVGQQYWVTAMAASRINFADLSQACGHAIAVTYEAVREGFRLGILGPKGAVSRDVERYLEQRDTYAVIPPHAVSHDELTE